MQAASGGKACALSAECMVAVDFSGNYEYNKNVKKVKNKASKTRREEMRKNMEIAKVSSKGQITIPVSVRNKLKLKTGDKIVIFEENGRFCGKTPQCWHSNGQRRHFPARQPKQDLKRRKICRITCLISEKR